jgi:hypothetical protein
MISKVELARMKSGGRSKTCRSEGKQTGEAKGHGIDDKEIHGSDKHYVVNHTCRA